MVKIVIEEILKPVKEVDPGWWNLRWRPIKHRGMDTPGTWNVYLSRNYFRSGGLFIGGRCSYSRFSNYGASHKCLRGEICLIKWSLEFWIKWNYSCMTEGRIDLGRPAPLKIK